MDADGDKTSSLVSTSTLATWVQPGSIYNDGILAWKVHY